MEILQRYVRASRQKINKDKSFITFSAKAPPDTKRKFIGHIVNNQNLTVLQTSNQANNDFGVQLII